MAGPIPVHPSEVFRYVLSQNRGDEAGDQVTFVCRTLTGRERNEVSDIVYALASEVVPATERVAAIKRAARECTLRCLQGWENWTDLKGSEVPFPSNPKGILEVLHQDDVTEIGSEIAVRSGLWGSPEVEDALSD